MKRHSKIVGFGGKSLERFVEDMVQHADAKSIWKGNDLSELLKIKKSVK